MVRIAKAASIDKHTGSDSRGYTGTEKSEIKIKDAKSGTHCISNKRTLYPIKSLHQADILTSKYTIFFSNLFSSS
jgi:hypothetical protein